MVVTMQYCCCLLICDFSLISITQCILFIKRNQYFVCRIKNFRSFFKYKCCHGYRFKADDNAWCVKGKNVYFLYILFSTVFQFAFGNRNDGAIK